MACTKSLMRKMPGRIVGQTKDAEGRRGFVSTLQTREQHIRREKATSNICSNQALNALAASVYLTTMGKRGLQEVARQCYDNSHYAASTITASGKYRLAYEKPFFKEFPIISTVSSERIQNTLLHKGIIGGYSLNRDYPELENGILYCVRKRTRQGSMCDPDFGGDGMREYNKLIECSVAGRRAYSLPRADVPSYELPQI